MSDLSPDPSPKLIGRHLLADLYGIEPTLLSDGKRLLDVVMTSLRDAHFSVVSHLSHQFPGDQAGVTAIVLLAESHAAFHTYPEHGYLALDIFSCGTPEPAAALAVIVEAFQPSNIHTSVERRGELLRAHSADANGTPSPSSASSAARIP
jgi:S-adenosylmethionine decarboxylase